MTRSGSKYTKELLENIVSRNVGVMGVLRDLGLKETGGSHEHIKRLIKQYDIDTSHFLGRSSNKGKINAGGNRLTPEQLLVKKEPSQPYAQSKRVIRALIEIGREYICERCGIGPYWLNKKLKIQLHHIDGYGWNNEPENLQFLCPNCHSQTSNFGKIKSVWRNQVAAYG